MKLEESKYMCIRVPLHNSRRMRDKQRKLKKRKKRLLNDGGYDLVGITETWREDSCNWDVNTD